MNVTKLYGLNRCFIKKKLDAAFQTEKSAVVQTNHRAQFQESSSDKSLHVAQVSGSWRSVLLIAR